MTDKEIEDTVVEYEGTYGLPTMDVLKHGCEKIVRRLLEVFPELKLSQSTAA
jgi:predicted ATPase